MNVRRTLLWMMIACLAVVESRPAHGADSTPPASPPRFLFIVEKSEASQVPGMDLAQTLFDLVYHGANGHLPYGGVFEIWVFGEETIIRGFAPQMLLPNNRLQLARMASAYVRTASSGGTVAVGKMAEHLLGATEIAQELTVFLLTAPDTRMSGTPRDAELNLVYDTNAEAQRAAGRPFITAIRIQDGLLAATSVSDSPFTMTVPPMPPTRMSPQQREALIAEARRLREEREKPPVVPVPVVEPASQLVDRNLPDEEREGAIILKQETGVVEPATEVAVVDPPVVAPVAETPPSVTPPQAVAESVTPAPATTPVEKPEPAVSEAARAETPVREIELPSQPTPAPSDPPVILQFQQAAAIDASLEPVSAPEPKPMAKPSETPPPTAAIVRSQLAEPASQTPAAPAVPPPVAKVEQRAAPASATPAPANRDEPKAGAPPAVDAVTAPSWFTAGGLFVAGIFFFSVAVLLTWVLMRRARTASGPSFITRSIDDRRR